MRIVIATFTVVVLVLLSSCASTQLSAPKTEPKDRLGVRGDKTFGHYSENLEPNLVLVTVTPDYYAALTKQPDDQATKSLPPQYVDFLDDLQRRYGLTRVGNWPLSTIDIFCIVFENTGGLERDNIIESLPDEPGIETAQRVELFSTKQSQTTKYNDPFHSLQHGFHSMQASTTHGWSRGAGVRVAVIDTGVDHDHPDLTGNTEITKNYVDNDEELFRSDSHGTAVGGVIAAAADNAAGIVGIAPESKLLALKACWHSPENKTAAYCNTLTLAKALNYSIAEQVDIINLSLTGPPDPILHRLVGKAIEEGIVVVGAKPDHDRPSFPISVKGTIPAALPNELTSAIKAPGQRVISTSPNKQYDFFDGSSFSSAHISGLAALVRALAPEVSPAQMLKLLQHSSDPQTGVVDACRMFEILKGSNATSTNGNHC